jgi:Fusaric acid resistance protein-like
MPAGLSHVAIERLRTGDPERDGLRRAVRAAIVVPLAAAVSFFVVGGSQAPLFTIIGAFWLMVLVDFPGSRQRRALAHCGVGFNGAVLITLGTLVAPMPWLAVTLMFVLGVAVTLTGVLSETIAAGQRVTMLTYVLPVCTPIGPIGERLLGWAIALVVCIPAALFLLPPRHHSGLRSHAAQVCGALADRLEGVGSASQVSRAMKALRANFFDADFRPVSLTAGSQALVQVVDDLEWVTDRVDENTGAALAETKEPAVMVLRCCARVLDVARVFERTADLAELDVALGQLRSAARRRHRNDIVAVLNECSDDSAVAIGRALLFRRTITTVIGLTGRVIAAAAGADARPAWARALGLRLPSSGAADRLLPEAVAVRTIITGFLSSRSVAARNAVRTGVGLALAVAATHLFPVQHGFWVVLGAIAVMGSSALSTGTKVVRAVAGTAIGVTLGAALIAVVGVEPAVLWTLLPITVFAAAYVPRVASFVAGQAAFTMTVLIILNLIAPTGWRIGLVRIEDITAGAAVAVVVSTLLWPRGATASVSAAIDAAIDLGSRYLRAAVLRVSRGASEATDVNVTALSHDTLVAGRTVDDAVRHYLSETGNEADPRDPVVRAAARAVRLRSAVDTIADIKTLPPPSAYPRARAVLEAHADSARARLAGATDQNWGPVSDEFVLALRAEFTGDEATVEAALPLVTIAANLGELELTYPIECSARLVHSCLPGQAG